MGLRFKILSGFLILTVMLCVAGAWSIYELTNIGTSVQALLDDNYKSINAAKMMNEALEREDSAVLLLLSGNWDQGRSIIGEADTSFQEGFDAAKKNVTIPGEQAYVEAIQSKYVHYKKLWMRPIVGTPHEKDIDWYFTEVHSAFLDTKASVQKLMTLNDQTMYQTASGLKNRAHRAVMPGIVAILSALIFTMVFNYFVNYYIVSPIVRLTKGVRAFLETKQPLDVKVQTKDEVLDLVTSIQQLVAHSMADEKTK
jgi:NtrC-family two-component system sensor histidine kinase KinB